MKRFWAKVHKTESCWLWTACRNRAGYGRLRTPGASVLAHRQSWVMSNGPIPDGLHVLHKCDVPACVNPDHLFLGTDKANSLDREAKGRGIRRFGAAHWMAKLTESDVRTIRSLVSDGYRGKDCATLWGVTPTLVSAIVRRKVWRHVD